LKSILYNKLVVTEYVEYPYLIMIVQSKKGRLLKIEIEQIYD